jgi:hypothetical protein
MGHDRSPIVLSLAVCHYKIGKNILNFNRSKMGFWKPAGGLPVQSLRKVILSGQAGFSA